VPYGRLHEASAREVHQAIDGRSCRAAGVLEVYKSVVSTSSSDYMTYMTYLALEWSIKVSDYWAAMYVCIIVPQTNISSTLS
jgi:hypothetical protein